MIRPPVNFSLSMQKKINLHTALEQDKTARLLTENLHNRKSLFIHGSQICSNVYICTAIKECVRLNYIFMSEDHNSFWYCTLMSSYPSCIFWILEFIKYENNLVQLGYTFEELYVKSHEITLRLISSPSFYHKRKG